MRILILNEDLGLGGVESMSVQLANTLFEHDECEVFTAAADGPLRARLHEGIPFVLIPKFTPTAAPRLLTALNRVIARIRPDIVHSQGATIAFLARLAARSCGVRCLNLLTRHSRKTLKIPGLLGNPMMKWSCDHVIAISGSTYDDLRQLGFGHDGLSLIPNFLDLQQVSLALAASNPQTLRAQLGLPTDRRIIAMAGRLIPEKRFDHFINILAGVGRASGIKPVGLVLGEGAARPQLEQLAAHHADDAEIRFLGYQENIYPFLAISDVFLFPSEFAEVLPMALIEALAVGLPVVCSGIPGNRDVIVDGYNGLIVDGPTSAYVERLLRLLGDHDLMTTLAANAEATAREKYDRRVVVEKILALYRRLLANAANGYTRPVIRP